MILDSIKCLRIKHYIKNILIFVPFVFGVDICHVEASIIKRLFFGFFALCFVCSMVYLINDWNDRGMDAGHPEKSKRPIAAGKIRSVHFFVMLILLFFIVISFCCFGQLPSVALVFLLAYFVINILYSRLFKHVVIFDILVISSLYVIRIYYGAALVGVPVSNWLFMTIQCFALYLAGGKRYGELDMNLNAQIDTRGVLKNYSSTYLKEVMQLFLGLTVVFYVLWIINVNEIMIITVPIVLFSVLRYQYDVSVLKLSDPVELLYQDKIMIIILFMYICTTLFLKIYGF